MNKHSCFLIIIGLVAGCSRVPDYQNTRLSPERRAADLVSRMTLEEKVSQMSHLAPAIERLGIHEYGPNFNNPLMNEGHPDYTQAELDSHMAQRAWENHEYWEEGDCLDGGWWNEALHGVARAGLATAFPQSIGLGSTWDPDLIQQCMDAAGKEARIHQKRYNKKLTYWSPTINMLRDPRWGRNEECYSEDPYLQSRMAVAFVKGFQGSHKKYVQAIATVKHFVANNSEYNRHTGSADVSERWLREYYFPAFRAAVQEARVGSFMSAYNAVNGVPVSASVWLLNDVLREEWGFKGYVVSDCGAVSDIVHGHGFEPDPEKAVALAAIAGTDLECETCETEQFLYDKYMMGALEKGYVTEDIIDRNVTRLFRARMLLGEFDPPEKVPYTQVDTTLLDCEAHRELALQAARESIVLLKNENHTLPLKPSALKRIAVIGPNADVAELGGYSGMPSFQISPLQGIREYAADDFEVHYLEGCSIAGREEIGWDEENDRPVWKYLEETQGIADAAALAGQSDVAIVVLGTNLSVANEAADRVDLGLPGNQLELVQNVFNANPNTIVVLMNGMPLTINWVAENAPAILEVWYPGQSGGTALAEVLFGAYNPGGRLPVTFYKDVDALPPLGDYDITRGRTYWFADDENVLYPFGWGLSYSTFFYKRGRLIDNNLNRKKKDGISLVYEVLVENRGPLKGDEVVQLHVRDVESSVIQPKSRLRAFKRITLDAGESTTVTFDLNGEDFSFWDENEKKWRIEPGKFEIETISFTSMQGHRSPLSISETEGGFQIDQ